MATRVVKSENRKKEAVMRLALMKAGGKGFAKNLSCYLKIILNYKPPPAGGGAQVEGAGRRATLSDDVLYQSSAGDVQRRRLSQRGALYPCLSSTPSLLRYPWSCKDPLVLRRIQKPHLDSDA